MKKLFFLLVFSFSFCFSQTDFIFPFNSDSSRWIYDHTNAFYGFVIERVTCSYGKDTLLPNNKIYKPFGKYFYFRKDGSKIYQYSSNNSSEFVRYDFSKHVGDTVSYRRQGSYDYVTLMTGDQNKVVFGQSRRVLTFQGNNDVWDDVADSIGIIDFGLGVEDYFELTGAIISGNIYGNITSVANQNNLIPNTLYLSQNYPNPFNPITTIEYEIPKGMNVRIIITNELGQQVKEILNSYKQQGSYRIEWNASNCSSGIYYCTMIGNGFQKTTKLILLK